MIRINLAPPDQRQFRPRLSPVGLAAAAIAAMSGLGAWYAVLTRAEARLDEQVAALTRELAQLQASIADGEKTRDVLRDLGRRTQAIHELTRGQGTPRRALDALLDALPADVGLTALDLRGASLRATGSAAAPEAVAAFTANLRAARIFRDVEILASRQDLGTARAAAVSFEVSCGVAP
jgi:Tfp pilus assembly protein PilN